MDKEILIEPLGNIFKTTSGGTPSRKKPEFYLGNIPWVKSGELENNIIYGTEERITEDAIKNSSAKIFPAGTLLIALYGATIGKLAFLGIKATTNQAVCGIFDNGVILSKYMYYFLLFRRQKLIQSGMGGAQPNISQDIVRKQPFPIIPLPKQRAIVSKIEQLFSDLDNGIDNFKKAQEQLKRYRQSVLKAACEGRLVPTEAELACDEGRDYEPADVLLARILKERREKWNGKGKYKEPAAPDMSSLQELPEGWVWNKLWLCCNLITKGESPKWQGFEYIEEGIPFIRSENVLWGNVNLLKAVKIPEEFHNKLIRSQLKPFDVLINIVGASIGRCGVVPSTIISANINQAVSLIRVNNALLPSYLVQLLLSPQLQKNIHAGKVDTARPNISLGDLRQLLIPLPPLAEQRRIVVEVERHLSLCDKMEATIAESLQKAESLRQSILKKAFEGKLLNEKELEEARNAPDWEPAEKLLERIRQEKQIKENNNKPTRRKTHG